LLQPFDEGWHNNHHHYRASLRNGFFWWELDLTYYAVTLLSWAGVARDVQHPPAALLARNRVREGRVEASPVLSEAGMARAAETDVA
jgi:hypothetical protein